MMYALQQQKAKTGAAVAALGQGQQNVKIQFISSQITKVKKDYSQPTRTPPEPSHNQYSDSNFSKVAIQNANKTTGGKNHRSAQRYNLVQAPQFQGAQTQGAPKESPGMLKKSQSKAETAGGQSTRNKETGVFLSPMQAINNQKLQIINQKEASYTTKRRQTAKANILQLQNYAK